MTATEGFMKAQIEQLKKENEKLKELIGYIMVRENITYIEKDGEAFELKDV